MRACVWLLMLSSVAVAVDPSAPKKATMRREAKTDAEAIAFGGTRPMSPPEDVSSVSPTVPPPSNMARRATSDDVVSKADDEGVVHVAVTASGEAVPEQGEEEAELLGPNSSGMMVLEDQEVPVKHAKHHGDGDRVFMTVDSFGDFVEED
eukprot:gnl/TRDRNA2_/TRDRNA2_173724_c0_seq5.p1 gnl/TRDRNA2_/TRDRNA2_173724_c0~~gnl/TRDRNA2_/TRDRNA2_173724_c0_seq5.p1  ORF type:complete len:150 (-),score=37.98 gnl/TRDRNA2_/TRDRNA2_173724_c0_seq5:126-575(-)